MKVIQASNAGLNSMEHLRNLELSCASNADELLAQRQQLLYDGRRDPGGILRSRIHRAQRQDAIENYSEEQADKVISVLAKNKTWQIPTLALSTGSVRRPFATAEWAKSFQYMPVGIAKRWENAIADFSKNEISNFQKEYSQWLINIIGKLHGADVPIMAGTDCPIFFLTPGRSLHEELVALVEAGLTPQEALYTATIAPAKYFKMDSELGNIKPGMWADLVLLSKNPLDNINHTLSIEKVIKQGEVYK